MARPAKDPFRGAVIYQVKRDALLIVAEMGKGNGVVDMERMSRMLAFVQKELIQAAYNDPALDEQSKKTLVEYHMLNVRAGIGERRAAQRRANHQ